MVGNSTMYTGKKINKNNVGIAQRGSFYYWRGLNAHSDKDTERKFLLKNLFQKVFYSKNILIKNSIESTD